jgi:Na+-translocating ferredoxin:NAD+ oxidoreductase RnfD subunit
VSISSARDQGPPLRAIRRFFATPKGLLTIVLAILVALAAPTEGIARLAPGLGAAVVFAGLLDAVILRWRDGAWVFPSGAILTALIVAMVLSPHEPWHVTAITSALAVASKYLARGRSANVFNPAALAIVATSRIFGTGQSWWGALPDVHPAALIVLFSAGIFIADRVNKMPMVIAFLGTYFALFTITAFVADPARVAEIFRSPDAQAVLFFAFFILTDPPTSPVKYGDQIVCAVIVAVVAYMLFEFVGTVSYLLIAVLVGNVWEARRRAQAHVRKQVERAHLRAGTA